jgi:hypothetical protein
MDRAEIGLDGARCGASVTEIVPIGNASTLSDILIPLHVDLSMKVAFVASTPIMSYQGGHIPSNVYWAGHAPPPNAYARQDPRQMPPHPAQNPGSQYQPMSNRNEQHWNQNGPVQIQNGYSVNPGYANNNYQQPQIPPPQAHVQGPTQYISPAQLFQSQPQQQYQYQRSAPVHSGRGNSSSSSFNNAPTMAMPAAQDPLADKSMLLVSLAEEYFQAAHTLAPSVTASMSPADVGSYEKLVATGLGCLDTALKNVKLQSRMEASIRLRYAGVLYEETENSMEAEICLTKGISLCERVCFSRRVKVCSSADRVAESLL